jgi:hypothetical protein
VARRHAGVPPRRRAFRGNRMLDMTNENFARLLRGLTIAVGNRTNRILLYQFLAAEIRALREKVLWKEGKKYQLVIDCDGEEQAYDLLEEFGDDDA